MSALHELQNSFRDALLSGDTAAAENDVCAGGLSVARRLGIYRNTVFTNLREALRAIFPVVERLVDTDFFNGCSDEYSRRYPSPAGDLNRFGAQFGEFLATFAPAASLPYLPDVARLEWQVNQVYHAADHAALDLAHLATLAPEHYETLRITLHPASALLASLYPVQRIWQVNQPDHTGTLDVHLDSGGVRLLIERHGGHIVLRALSDGEWALLRAIADGAAFAAACTAALSAEADYDIGAALQTLVSRSTLIDFTLP